MRLTEGSVSLRTTPLLLGLWVVLAAVRCSQGHPSWRYISSEVVIPRKELHHGKGIRMPGWLSYSLHFGGQKHVIHMRRKKLFWPRHLVLMSQDDQGVLQVDDPFVPLDCYYLGYLEEVPLSMVTIDTCYGGLEGIMKLDDIAYEIKPLRDAPGFEHVVSQIVADTDAIGPMYMLGYKEVREPLFSQANSSAAARLSSKLYSSHRGHVKGCVMSSYSIYALYNNMTKCAIFLINLGSLIDSMFQALDVSFYISIMVIYNEREPTAMDNYAVPGSPFFQYYGDTIFNPNKPLTGLIVIRNGPHELENEPEYYQLCGHKSLLMLGELSRHYLLLSVIAAHKFGRSFGLYYDDQYCFCQRRATCIMYRYPVLTDSFSNCSFEHTQHILQNNLLQCLFNTTMVYLNRSLTHHRCGNGVVDGNEQCDCGSFKQCYENTCCQTDCRLTPGSTCNRDTCCANCTYAPKGTLCRPVRNICDLPEYCFGNTPRCPEDVYLQDGTPCTEDSYCYEGNCTDRSMHCKEIFGEGALNGPDACYQINSKGSRFGHCELSLRARAVACAAAHVKCGRLQCINVTHLPRLQEHVGFHQSLIQGSLCFGTGTHRGTGTVDVGIVRNGTPCGDGRLCLAHQCSGSLAAINYDCHPSKCNLRGVCNNKKHCHCHVGWEPPRCIHRGSGGSVDGGSPPRRMRSVSQSDLLVLYLRIVFGRLYIFIAALLFGVAMNMRTIKTTGITEEVDNQN